LPGIIGPDDLSGWEAAPPAARARGAPELIRIFDSAEAALEFLARQAAARHPREARSAGSAAGANTGAEAARRAQHGGDEKAAPLRRLRVYRYAKPITQPRVLENG
jgi:hypothetical protein